MALIGSLLVCHSVLYLIAHVSQQDEQDASRTAVVVLFVVCVIHVIDAIRGNHFCVQVLTWLTVFLAFGSMCIADDIGCGVACTVLACVFPPCVC